ncbi:MAG: hypothetical protein J5770_02215 [Bacteroidaceae bacterium]|nr:hypothetical protein [Bacteroidaceae bacterium]
MGDKKEIKPANRQEVKHFALDDALTEVMRRRVAAEPRLPAEFSQRIADAMTARRRKARLRTIVGWSTLGAIAACLLLVFWLGTGPSKSPLKGNLTTRNIEAGSEQISIVSSDSLVFEPLYKQTALFPIPLNSSFKERKAENLFINGYPLISPHKGGDRGGLYSKLAPGVYIEIDEEGDTVYVVISSQNVPTPPKSVLPEVNIAERMQQAEEFGKQLRKEFDSIHLALNK